MTRHKLIWLSVFALLVTLLGVIIVFFSIK